MYDTSKLVPKLNRLRGMQPGRSKWMTLSRNQALTFYSKQKNAETMLALVKLPRQFASYLKILKVLTKGKELLRKLLRVEQTLEPGCTTCYDSTSFHIPYH